jgi:hypothetical protein
MDLDKMLEKREDGFEGTVVVTTIFETKYNLMPINSPKLVQFAPLVLGKPNHKCWMQALRHQLPPSYHSLMPTINHYTRHPSVIHFDWFCTVNRQVHTT